MQYAAIIQYSEVGGLFSCTASEEKPGGIYQIEIVIQHINRVATPVLASCFKCTAQKKALYRRKETLINK